MFQHVVLMFFLQTVPKYSKIYNDLSFTCGSHVPNLLFRFFLAAFLHKKSARWGTAQLLANLGDATWIQAAGSEAAVAAVLSLRTLEAADEAGKPDPGGPWQTKRSAIFAGTNDNTVIYIYIYLDLFGKKNEIAPHFW